MLFKKGSINKLNQAGLGLRFGAIAGSAIGGDVAEGDPKPTGKYRIERECRRESRYKEDRKRVYTHSTVTFWDDKLQRNITLEYQNSK